MAAEVWVQRITVQSMSDMTTQYVVARKADGSMGCSCPKWIFQGKPRRDCKHILALLEHVPEWGRRAAVKATPKQVREAKVRTETKTVGGYVFTLEEREFGQVYSAPVAASIGGFADERE